MKRALVAMVIALAAGCGGSDGGSGGATKNLANFQGATWNGTLTTTITCGTQSQSGNGSIALVLSPGSGADLQYTSASGCLFKFNVSDSTASLANAPVSCSTTVNGTVFVLTITSYTLTTQDGHNLTLQSAGTISSGGQSCPVGITGSATR
jgi:hypothetical protein